MSAENVKNLLKSYGLKPSKRLGQNFLIDEQAFGKILEAAGLSKNDIVLEIGPGIGNLTAKLAKKAKKVIAVEKDKKMCELLKSQNLKNVEIVNQDALELDIEHLDLKSYKLVANLPYYITSPVIRKFLEAKNRPKLIVLMLQKEVAQRISSSPPDSLLAVSVQFYAKAEIVGFVPKKSFWPEPKVDSAIIKIAPLDLDYPQEFVDLFFKIVKAGFSAPRKQLANNLSKALKISKKDTEAWLLENNIQPSQRAEKLMIDDWKKLAENYIIKQ